MNSRAGISLRNVESIRMSVVDKPNTASIALPKVPLLAPTSRWRKSTKQVATVGPASNNVEMLEKLFLAGVDVFRLNFSHGEHSEKAAVIHHG